MAKIGILGGTFNPIHNGHIQLGLSAVGECSLDKLIIMPSGVSYLKKDQKIPSGEIRLHMCELASSQILNCEVSNLEIMRSGNTYTYDTLEQLKELYPEDDLFFIIGADSLYYIEKWVNIERIFSLCTIVCALRGEADDYANMQIVADKLSAKYDANIILLQSKVLDISSTALRNMFNSNPNNPKILDYICEEEYRYIVENKIYES